MLDKKITFIGSGAMAEAMISSLLRQKLARPEDLRTSDTQLQRVQELHEKFGVQPFTDNVLAVEQADVVVLSVKPQRLAELLRSMKGTIPSGAVIISIVAGATIDKISKGLKHNAIVRSMPNTPAQIGEGITVWIASQSVSEAQKRLPGRSWAPLAMRSMWTMKITSIWLLRYPAPVRRMYLSSWKP